MLSPLIISEGKDTLEFTREEMMLRIRTKRIKNLIEKAMKINQNDYKQKFYFNIKVKNIIPDIIKGFKSIGVPYSDSALVNKFSRDISLVHPIVLSLLQTSWELQNITFSDLDDLKPETVSPVEYLPIVSVKSYFSDRSSAKVYLSKILLDCFKEALDDKRLNKT